MISSDYNREDTVTKEIQFRTDAYAAGPWYALCGLKAEGETEVVGFMGIANSSHGFQYEYYETMSLEKGYDTWHTVRLEMDPNSLSISCAVDEQQVGSAIPNDAEFLATVQFSKVIEAARGPLAFATTYVDNVYFEAPTVRP